MPIGRTRLIVLCATAFACVVLLGVGVAAQKQPPTLEGIRQQYERHNYAWALDALDTLIAQTSAGPERAEAQVLRVLCLLGLNRPEQAVPAAEELLAGEVLRDLRLSLHHELAELGERDRSYAYLAVDHLEALTDLYLEDGRRDDAARTQLDRGDVLTHFGDWSRSKTTGALPVQADWQEQRRFQRDLVVRCYDRAAELAADEAIVFDALMNKARAYTRQLYVEEKDIARGIAVLGEIVQRWPETNRAARAQLSIGELYETRQANYVSAVAALEKVLAMRNVSPQQAAQASERIARIQSANLNFQAEGTLRPGEHVSAAWHTRNVKEVTFSIYPVDLVELMSQVESIADLSSWREPAEAPVQRWTLSIPDDGTYRTYQSGQVPGPTASPEPLEAGTYVLVGTAEGIYHDSVRFAQLLVVTNLEVIVQADHEHVLVWANDVSAAAPAPGADVRLFIGQGPVKLATMTGTTDNAGLWTVEWPGRLKPGQPGQVQCVVTKGDQRAHLVTYRSDWGEPGWEVYSFTDRPVYRPEQTVHFKHTLRRQQRGGYENAANRNVTLRIRNPQGEVVHEGTTKTNAFGTVSGDWTIPGEPPLGVYRMEVELEGQMLASHLNSGAMFRVEEYRKPEFKVTVTPGESSYRLGQTVSARINAAYYFGDPVVGAEVSYNVFRTVEYPRYHLPGPWRWFLEDGFVPHFATGEVSRCWMPPWFWQRAEELVASGKAVTDAKGNAAVAVETAPDVHEPDADVRYTIKAEVLDNSGRTIEGSGSVVAAKRAFRIQPTPQRNLYEPGETVHIDLSARDPNDTPVAFEGKAEVFRLGREWIEKEQEWRYTLGDRVASEGVSVPQQGGAFRWVADESGPFRFVFTANVDEPAELRPTAHCDVLIVKPGERFGRYAYREVELVFDKPLYTIGDTAKVLVTAGPKDAYVLLTFSADGFIDKRVLHVIGGSALVEVPLAARHAPNVHVQATLVGRDEVFRDEQQVHVIPTTELLTVSVDTPAEEFDAGTRTTATVMVQDATGTPAQAEVAVMAVDASLFYIQPEFRERIEKFFWGRQRDSGVWDGNSYFEHRRGRVFQRGDGMMQLARARGGVEADMMLGAPMASMKESAAADEAGFAMPEIRSEFADAIVWLAHGTTDAEGKLAVEVPFSDDLTTWRITAVAVDEATRVGEAATEVVTTKDIIARLQTPRFLVQGDRAVLSVIAHNDTEHAVRARVSLDAFDTLTLHEVVLPDGSVQSPGTSAVEADVPGKGEVVIGFAVSADVIGSARVQATVATKDKGDAVERAFPIIPYGADKLVARNGVIRPETPAAQTVQFELPREMDLDSPLLEIRVTPSLAAVMIDALPYLLDYPYGCVEQTMSRFLPAVVTRKTLQELGYSLADIRTRIERQGGPQGNPALERMNRNPVFSDKVMDDMIRAGISRLATMQHADGGWGWWTGDASNPYMTAYVVYGLAEARAADVAFDFNMLERGVAFLKQRLASDEQVARYEWARDDDNVRAWMLFALATADPKHLKESEIGQQLTRVFGNRDQLTDYGRAMLALTLHRAGDADRAKIVVENLDNTVRIDQQTGTASWGDARGYWRWYDNGLEATAMCVRALLAVDPDSRHVVPAVNWLVRNRRGAAWYSTKDTAICVYALAEYLTVSEELTPDMTVTVQVDEGIRRSFRVTRENVLDGDAVMLVSAQALPSGPHRVTVSREGTGSVYFSAYLDYYTKERPITAAGNEVYVTRTYYRLTPKEVQATRSVWDEHRRKWVEETYTALDFERAEIRDGEALLPGQLIEAELAIDARNNFEYMMFIDPKPAGCEPVELRSGAAYGDDFYGNVELRDEHVAFFATWLPQGQRMLTYRLRCETPGVFTALPAYAEAMYAPFVRGSSNSDELRVGEAKRE